MKNPLLKKPFLMIIVILVIAGFVSWFTLLFGFAHLIEGIIQLIEGTSPNIPVGETILGWFFVIVLCIIGIITLFITIAAIKAIISKLKKS